MKTTFPSATGQRLQAFFGGLGYLSLLFLWLWAAILLVPPLFKLPLVNDLVLPRTEPQVETPPSALEVPPIVVGSAVAFSLIIVIIGLIAAARTPKVVANTTSRTIHRTARTAAQKVQPQPKDEMALFRLSERFVWYAKLGLIFVGYGLCCLAALVTRELAPQLILVVASFLAIWPLIWFSAQRLVTRGNQAAY